MCPTTLRLPGANANDARAPKTNPQEIKNGHSHRDTR